MITRRKSLRNRMQEVYMGRVFFFVAGLWVATKTKLFVNCLIAFYVLKYELRGNGN